MSALLAATRVSLHATRRTTPVFLPQLVSRRCLGETIRGPPIADIPKNFKLACDFFTKDAISYGEFKQQCVSLRLFAFAGVTAGCAVALCFDPPKSSYWQRWSPTWWLSHLRGCFTSNSGPLFLSEKVTHEVDVPSIVGVLIPRGRIVVPAAASAEHNPKVLFVLGGPGAGKGTQCTKIVENFKQWSHISAGDCLREERNNPNSKDGELINSIIKDGKIVPSEITVRLLEKAMATQQEKEGKTCFLIDGFPRSLENMHTWEKVVGDRADCLGVLFYEADEEEMAKRLLGRGATSGRVDDNIETIRKRFQTHMHETMPIVKSYAARGMVYSIDGMPTPDKVWSETQKTIKKIQGSMC